MVKFCAAMVMVLGWLLPGTPALAGEVVLTISPRTVVREIPPGVIGWGAMWKSDLVWPVAPKSMDDTSHAQFIEDLGRQNAPLVQRADMRNISWPWGVNYSTWAVNWENSAKPWSQRSPDCVSVLGRVSTWCETTVVGVGDLMTLARMWHLEALTVAVPLAVVDGKNPRWGPGFCDHVFSDATIEQIADHAYRLIEYMKRQPGWNELGRVYLSAGTEWRHYGLHNPSPAVLSYAKLVRRIRQRIVDPKVIVVACASDSTDIPGVKYEQAISWNRYLYRELHAVPGVAMDLHRYRGVGGITAGADGRTPLTGPNIRKMLATGLRQRKYLTVQPADWGDTGPAMASVLLENAIQGHMNNHATHSQEPRPWPVVMAHADLVREALASPALTFLAWTWFPEDLPEEWPHGALLPAGQLSRHAAAQAFLSHFHRGKLLSATMNDESSIRANAVRGSNGQLFIYGGNFSQQGRSLQVILQGLDDEDGRLEIMTESGVVRKIVKLPSTITLPAMSLWRWQQAAK